MLSRTPGVVDGRLLGQDRDALLALEVARIHDPVDHGLVGAEGAGLAEHRVHERGLAVVDVRHDGDVAEVGADRGRRPGWGSGSRRRARADTAPNRMGRPIVPWNAGPRPAARPVSFGHGPLRHLSELRCRRCRRAISTASSAGRTWHRPCATAASVLVQLYPAIDAGRGVQVLPDRGRSGSPPRAGIRSPTAGVTSVPGSGSPLSSETSPQHGWSGTLMVTYRQEGHA